jgi:hypothetical protein
LARFSNYIFCPVLFFFFSSFLLLYFLFFGFYNVHCYLPITLLIL